MPGGVMILARPFWTACCICKLCVRGSAPPEQPSQSSKVDARRMADIRNSDDAVRSAAADMGWRNFLQRRPGEHLQYSLLFQQAEFQWGAPLSANHRSLVQHVWVYSHRSGRIRELGLQRLPRPRPGQLEFGAV